MGGQSAAFDILKFCVMQSVGALARASDTSGQWCGRFNLWQTGQRTAVRLRRL
jgi:hypothetical protein